MTKSSILVPVLASAALLAGCAGGTQNRGLESVHQPVVSRSDYLLDLNTSGGRLAPGESQRLGGWLNSMRVGYGDQVAIDDPAGSTSGVRDQVATVVASFGLLLGDEPPVTSAGVTPGTVRVVVSRARASVHGCPDWSRNSSRDFDQHTSSNFGCATNSTLAAMVANPNDLVSGQGTGGADPQTNYRAIDAYRKAAPTGDGGTATKAQNTGSKLQ